MDYSNYVYIASCVFTRHYPELSVRIQQYLKNRFSLDIVRCCALSYKVKEYEEQKALMQDYCKRFATDKVITYCHYCSEGIILGGKTEEHLASLLFGGKYHYQ